MWACSPSMYSTSALNRDSSALKPSSPHESLQSLEESGLRKVGIFLAGFDLVRQETAGDLRFSLELCACQLT